MQRRSDIEGLRAIAVLAVLLFHAGVPRMDGGYIGVDVFFVVSGFLITSLLVTERVSSGTISLGAFYARRVRRLLPVSAVVAIVTLIGSRLWLEPIRLESVANDVIGVATFSSNFLFAHRGADYLQASLPPSPLQHYWSLAVEEQFYVVWPALIALVCMGVGTLSHAVVRIRVAIVATVVAVASFIACMAMMNTSQPWAFFSPHTRAFELAIGALIAVAPLAASLTARRISSALAWVGLAVIVASVFLFDEFTKFPGPWALVPVMGTAFLLRGGDSTTWAPKALLQLAPFQWLGSRSYSAYLWHWPILILAEAQKGSSLTITEGLACTVIGLALSEFSYRIIENPIRHMITIRGLRAAAFSVSVISVLIGAAVLSRENPPNMQLAGEVSTPTLNVATTVPTSSSVDQVVPVAPTLPPLSAPIEPIVQAMNITGLPSNLTPKLQSALMDQPVIYGNGCHLGFGAVSPKPCYFGDKESTTVVGMYGDSHMAQWFPTLNKVAKERKWKLVVYTKRGCPPADVPVYSKVLGKVYTQCPQWRRNVMEQMKIDGVKVVFVAHFDRLLDAESRIPIWQKNWREGMQKTIDDLSAAGIRPIIMQDTPYPGQMIPACLSRNYTSVNLCTPIVSAAYRDDMDEILVDFEKQGVSVLWVRDWFCTSAGCPTVVGNILVYRDDNHMTVHYAEFIAPLLDAAVSDVVNWYSRTP